MYLAKTNTLQIHAPFYVNILEEIIADNENCNKSNIDTAIKEAIEIAKEEKDVFSINNNHYFIVTTLLSKYKDKLLNLTESSFSKKTYSEILDILK